MYDIKILGGGVAGLACGIEAQSKGLKTIIFDKDDLPKRKTCGGLLTQKSMKLLDYLGLDRTKYITYMKEQVDIYLDENIELRNFDIPYVLFCDRFNLSKEMVQRYKELGGEIETSVNINKVEAKRTIYANGVSFEDYINHKNHFATAIICENPDKNNPEKLVITFDKNIRGYRWRFPGGELGIGGLSTKVRYIREQLHDQWCRGALLPYGYPILDKNKIGDRAGLCSPITGEGIYYALRSGIDCANNKGHFKLWFRLKFEKLLADMFWNIGFVKNFFKNKDFSYFVISKLLN